MSLLNRLGGGDRMRGSEFSVLILSAECHPQASLKSNPWTLWPQRPHRSSRRRAFREGSVWWWECMWGLRARTQRCYAAIDTRLSVGGSSDGAGRAFFACKWEHCTAWKQNKKQEHTAASTRGSSPTRRFAVGTSHLRPSGPSNLKLSHQERYAGIYVYVFDFQCDNIKDQDP